MTDEVRGFPSFPPGRRPRRRAGSWWGTAWLEAVEDSSLDHEQLRRGRRYAQLGSVGSITVSPGRITAPVHDGVQDTWYQTHVRVDELSTVEWDRFLDEMAAKAGYIAALLDGEMPRDLGQAAEAADVPLLPGLGDLQPECTCPDWEFPCKHAAALCYQVSWLLDEDPFLLLLMRGRGRGQLLDQLRARGAELGRIAAPAGPPGVLAGDAYAAGVVPLPSESPLSAEPALPPEPALPAWHLGAPGPLLAGAGVDLVDLQRLAQAAAFRARELLSGNC